MVVLTISVGRAGANHFFDHAAAGNNHRQEEDCAQKELAARYTLKQNGHHH